MSVCLSVRAEGGRRGRPRRALPPSTFSVRKVAPRRSVSMRSGPGDQCCTWDVGWITPTVKETESFCRDTRLLSSPNTGHPYSLHILLCGNSLNSSYVAKVPNHATESYVRNTEIIQSSVCLCVTQTCICVMMLFCSLSHIYRQY